MKDANQVSNPAAVIASHLAKHLKNLQKMQRQLEAFMPNLREAIEKTQNLTAAFEKSGEANQQPEPKGATASAELLSAAKEIHGDLCDRLRDVTASGTRQTMESQIEMLASAIAKAEGR